MPTVVTSMPPPPVTRRKLWTRAECEALQQAGYFEGQHVELIEGELIDKMGKQLPHGISMVLFRAWLLKIFDNMRVIQEHSIFVAPKDNETSEPEPDLIVLAGSILDLHRNPKPEDIVLLIEIANSSLGLDLRTKAGLYARAGIPDYWVLDINCRQLYVHRSPEGISYRSVVAYTEQEAVSPLAAPDRELRIAEVLPR